MNIYEKLLGVQGELKAPKSQYNSFGKYSYRNCEDILEAVKPLLREYKLVLFLSDEIVEKGSRVYVMARATLVNVENPEEKLCATAYAREEEEKKGMDGSQVTGAASSYARKYALNGLFDIDDTKDSDTTNQHGKASGTAQKQQKQPASTAQPKAKSGLPKATTDMLNRAIFDYSKASGATIKSVVQTIEKNLGKTMKEVVPADVDAIREMLDIWTSELTDNQMEG